MDAVSPAVEVDFAVDQLPGQELHELLAGIRSGSLARFSGLAVPILTNEDTGQV